MGSARCWVMTVDKLFTHMWVCHQFGNYSPKVEMLCGWDITVRQ